MNSLSRTQKPRAGFTLLEVMVVIVIYPTTEQGLEALIQQPANMADARNYRTGGYIKRLPKDPWGNDYQYLSPGEKGLFDVYTLGADGQENGEGAGADIGNWNLQEFQ